MTTSLFYSHQGINPISSLFYSHQGINPISSLFYSHQGTTRSMINLKYLYKSVSLNVWSWISIFDLQSFNYHFFFKLRGWSISADWQGHTSWMFDLEFQYLIYNPSTIFFFFKLRGWSISADWQGHTIQ